jgi:hypothetical protein
MGYDTSICKAFKCYNTATFKSGYCAEHDPETIQEERLDKLEKQLKELTEYINKHIALKESNKMNCQKCGKEESTLREILLSCQYDLDNMDIPFAQKEVGFYKNDQVKPNFLYNLKVCVECRSLFMEAIKNWFEKEVEILSNITEGSGIFVNINGQNQEVSEKEFDRMYPGSLPQYKYEKGLMKIIKETNNESGQT